VSHETNVFLDYLASLPPVPAVPSAARDRRALLAERFDSGPDDVLARSTRRNGIPVREFSPPPGLRAAGTLVYVHGGGWVAGDTRTHDGICRWLCRESGYEVVSVEYRRAPESKHPAAVEDVVTVLLNIGSHASPGTPLAIAGDSSGAHIALQAALVWSNTSRHDPLSRMILIQPACDPTMSEKSWRVYGSAYFLTAKAMRWFWDSYIPVQEQKPLWDADLSCLPDTLIIRSTLDPSQDEAEVLARAMQSAGVNVDERCLEDLPHGCLTMPAAFPSAVGHTIAAAHWLRALPPTAP